VGHSPVWTGAAGSASSAAVEERLGGAHDGLEARNVVTDHEARTKAIVEDCGLHSSVGPRSLILKTYSHLK
jgi:hypothetical protein